MDAWSAPVVPELPEAGETGRPVLALFDSARREIAPVDVKGRPATMYVCGITPYDATHLGHAATMITFDLVQRLWRDAGVGVTYVQNVTDIDDPLLERATRHSNASSGCRLPLRSGSPPRSANSSSIRGSG